MTSMLKACEELCTAKRLRKLLGIVLKVGNRLNKAGNDSVTSKTAFSILSLTELNQVKAYDNKTTILTYIAMLIFKTSNEDFLNLREELPNVIKSQKMSLNFYAQLKDLSQKVDEMFKLALTLVPAGSENSGDERDAELLKLHNTSLGRFIIEAKETLLSLQDNHEVLKTRYENVLEYFAEKEMSPSTLFSCITSFCDDLESVKMTFTKKSSRRGGSWN